MVAEPLLAVPRAVLMNPESTVPDTYGREIRAWDRLMPARTQGSVATGQIVSVPESASPWPVRRGSGGATVLYRNEEINSERAAEDCPGVQVTLTLMRL